MRMFNELVFSMCFTAPDGLHMFYVHRWISPSNFHRAGPFFSCYSNKQSLLILAGAILITKNKHKHWLAPLVLQFSVNKR